MKRIVLAAVAALIAGGSAASAAVLDRVKERGTLVVGVKADYKPFGFRDPSGAVVGIEPELAADVARRLNVELELVPVNSANRIEFLQQGKIDLMIATMSDKPERRRSVTGIDPQYYADFVNVLLNKKTEAAAWEDLDGKTLCATSGAWYNREVAQTYGVEIVAFDGAEKPLFALEQGECVGYLYDQTFIQGKLTDARWSEPYAMPLPGILEAPWMMAVANGEDAFAEMLSAVTVDWMKTGRIVQLETKWGVKPTSYSIRMHEQHKGG